MSSTIFQASDLNQRGRAILDVARDSEAHLRDKDGLGLVMLSERRLAALRLIASAAANLVSIELALAASPDRLPAVHELGDWTWLRDLDLDDLQTFVAEMRSAILIGGREESETSIVEALRGWRASAEALADPVERAILLGPPPSADDFVEVQRPE